MSKVDKVEDVKAVDTHDLAAQLAALQVELAEMRKEKKALSDAEKKAVEDARDMMITDEDPGILFIDDRYKEEGYHYRIVDSTRVGRVERLKKIGYEVVEHEDFKIGASTVTNSTHLGAAVTHQIGGERSDRLGILMRIPLDRYNKRQEAKVRRNQEQTGDLLQQNVNNSSFGSIEFGSDTYKK